MSDHPKPCSCGQHAFGPPAPVYDHVWVTPAFSTVRNCPKCGQVKLEVETVCAMPTPPAPVCAGCGHEPHQKESGWTGCPVYPCRCQVGTPAPPAPKIVTNDNSESWRDGTLSMPCPKCEKAEAERDAYIKTAEMTYKVQADLRGEIARLREQLERYDEKDRAKTREINLLVPENRSLRAALEKIVTEPCVTDPLEMWSIAKEALERNK